MDNEFITKKCERCGEEVRVPGDYPEIDYILKAIQQVSALKKLEELP